MPASVERREYSLPVDEVVLLSLIQSFAASLDPEIVRKEAPGLAVPIPTLLEVSMYKPAGEAACLEWSQIPLAVGTVEISRLVFTVWFRMVLTARAEGTRNKETRDKKREAKQDISFLEISIDENYNKGDDEEQ